MEELFEFDLSDVDVAAFESVAATPPPPPQVETATTTTLTTPPLTDTDPTHITSTSTDTTILTESSASSTATLTISSATPSLNKTPSSLTSNQNVVHFSKQLHQTPGLSQQQQQHHHLTQAPQQQHHQNQLQQHVNQQIANAAAAAGQQPCKILLIPINSTKPGPQGIKQLLQLPPSTPQVNMSSLKSASGNKKQIVQLAPKHDNIFRPSTPNSLMIANEVPKRKPCNCTKSQCLKLYCDCFANGEFCSGCNCTNCFNSLSKEKERQKAITQCLERNPEAFRPKIGKAVKSAVGEPAPESIERRHTKGCNCKRSGCLKNYCECYEAKILCSNLCKCCGCKNYEESFERKTLMQFTNSSVDGARGILKSLLPTNLTSSESGRNLTKCFITDKVIQASLMCLLQSAQQAEKEGVPSNRIPNLIQTEMGRCLKMIVDSATESASISNKKR